MLDAKGEVLKQESIANSRGSLTALNRRYPGALTVMEVGMHSPWTSRFLKGLGHRVLVANPRKVATTWCASTCLGSVLASPIHRPSSLLPIRAFPALELTLAD